MRNQNRHTEIFSCTDDKTGFSCECGISLYLKNDAGTWNCYDTCMEWRNFRASVAAELNCCTGELAELWL
jgi:hypothetical protein